MKLIFANQVTQDGLTYMEGEHEVNDAQAQKIMHNFPDSVKPVGEKKAKAKQAAKPKPKILKKVKAAKGQKE